MGARKNILHHGKINGRKNTGALGAYFFMMFLPIATGMGEEKFWHGVVGHKREITHCVIHKKELVLYDKSCKNFFRSDNFQGSVDDN